MKIVVAMDSFKGSISARLACETVREGLLAAAPDDDVICVPMADGGEGTAEALLAARHGEWKSCRVMGPLPGRYIDAGFAWFADDRLAVVEMAAASGLTLLEETERNPLLTTTLGTGELLRAAADAGAQRILLAVGGSATVDGGTGAATALGWRFLDEAGSLLDPGGGALVRLSRIIPPAHPWSCGVDVLCDVDHPLLGPHGAAPVFGPQKGATAAMVAQLESGLERLAACVQDQLGMDIAHLPGGGAAGGLAAGAVAFLSGRLVPGIDAVMEASRLPGLVAGADWVLSGEGCFDASSLRGKVVSGILRVAQPHGVQVGVLAGCAPLPESEWQAAGLQFVAPTAQEGTPFEEARRTAVADLRRTAQTMRAMMH
jgi:glycerate 2-kinase